MNKTILLDQNKHWYSNIIYPFPITRAIFPDLLASMDLHLITYLTGARRLGKSVLFHHLINHLLYKKHIPQKQILYYSFSPNSDLSEIWELWEYYSREIADLKKPIFIFLDEIQYISGYENVIKQLYDTYPDLKISLTGSLSLSYKRRMQESLAGRYQIFRLFPLSFYEFLEISNRPEYDFINFYKRNIHHEIKPSDWDYYLSQVDPTFRYFLHHWRYPEMLSLPESSHNAYLNSLIDASLSQDAFAYFNIHNPLLLRSIYEQLITQNGGLISLAKLSSTSTSKTTSSYLDILDLMGMVYLLYNGTSPTQKLNSKRKAYVNSAFFLNHSPYNVDTSMGLAVESYILERLLTQNQEVSFYHHRQHELDFIVKNTKTAYEVKYRHNLPDFTELFSYSAKHKYSPVIITRNKFLESNQPSYIPACLF